MIVAVAVVVAREGDSYCGTTLSSIGLEDVDLSETESGSEVLNDGVSNEGNQYGFVRKRMQNISKTEMMREPEMFVQLDMGARVIVPRQSSFKIPPPGQGTKWAVVELRTITESAT